MARLDKQLRAFYEKYERVLIPSLLLFGFLVDIVTFRALQINSTFLLLGAHALFSGFAIMYSNIYDGRQTVPQNIILKYLRAGMPFLLQISFGSLLSSSLLFYWFSGSVSASWPIMILIVLLMASNEVFRHFYLLPKVQVGVYAFIVFSYFTLLFPFVFTSLSAWTFVSAGVTGVLFVVLFTLVLAYFTPHIRKQRTQILFAVAAVFISMNALYFLNIIPPIPLSIRDAGMYEDIVVRNGGYELVGQPESLLASLIPGQKIRAGSAGRVYAYTAIFAPTNLSTVIYHEWQFYDADERKWVTQSRLSFPMVGGRSAGYRGYTYKSNLAPGRWRVSIETERGQVLGRVPFTVSAP
ncbi:MAG: DUF2914 domain-containing protein [Patescibacteria group bacterium]|jgi:hypothetical protein